MRYNRLGKLITEHNIINQRRKILNFYNKMEQKHFDLYFLDFIEYFEIMANPLNDQLIVLMQEIAKQFIIFNNEERGE